jgi:hypothetical protein
VGPCERPVLGYGENKSGYLDDASIKGSTVLGYGENKSGYLDDATFEKT